MPIVVSWSSHHSRVSASSARGSWTPSVYGHRQLDTAEAGDVFGWARKEALHGVSRRHTVDLEALTLRHSRTTVGSSLVSLCGPLRMDDVRFFSLPCRRLCMPPPADSIPRLISNGLVSDGRRPCALRPIGILPSDSAYGNRSVAAPLDSTRSPDASVSCVQGRDRNP